MEDPNPKEVENQEGENKENKAVEPPPAKEGGGRGTETKVIYYIDDEETPYLMKIPRNPGNVMLKDFKSQLNRTYQKFFFKSVDDDFG